MNLLALSILCVIVLLLFLFFRNLLLIGKVKKLLSGGARVIDVRSEPEFRNGHFSTAKNIPVEQIAQRLDEVSDDKNAPVILYCYGGSRSAMAAGILKQNGFTRVTNARSYGLMQRFDAEK